MDSTRRLQNIRIRKARRTRWATTGDILEAFDGLDRMLEAGLLEAQASDFVPIRLVTIIENFVRDWIAFLVDIGDPFQPRADKIVKTVKFDYILSMAMHGREVSPGDIAADAISVNSLSDITSVFDKLLDQSTMALVAEAVDDDEILIVSDIDQLLAGIARIFEVRHTVVHEWPANRPYDVSELATFIATARTFTTALDTALGSQVWFDDPTKVNNVLLRNLAALRDAQAILSSSVEKLIKAIPQKEAEIRSAHEQWIAFASADTKMHAAIRENPVAQEILSAAHQEYLAEWRTEELRSLLIDLEG